MQQWRITKYNPFYRNEKGEFQKAEWISYFDIGRSYDGKALTLTEYLTTENRYIDVIKNIMKYLDMNYFQICELEKYENSVSKNENDYNNMVKVMKKLKGNICIEIFEIPALMRLILREYIWCKLNHPLAFVHFGYDYYMYAGVKKELTLDQLNEIKKIGLFIEPYISPYH